QADHQSDDVERAHERSRGRSQSAIKPSDRANRTSARASQKTSKGRLLSGHWTAGWRKARVRKLVPRIKIASRANGLGALSSAPKHAGRRLSGVRSGCVAWHGTTPGPSRHVGGP